MSQSSFKLVLLGEVSPALPAHGPGTRAAVVGCFRSPCGMLLRAAFTDTLQIDSFKCACLRAAGTA
jgi:hypothetical protein